MAYNTHIHYYILLVSTYLLEYFRGNWHHGVNRVCDDGHDSFRGVLRDALGKVAHDGRIHVEQVISGHTRLAGHASGNHHHIRICRWQRSKILVGLY